MPRNPRIKTTPRPSAYKLLAVIPAGTSYLSLAQYVVLITNRFAITYSVRTVQHAIDDLRVIGAIETSKTLSVPTGNNKSSRWIKLLWTKDQVATFTLPSV
jgi:hypothetical protein